MVSGDRFKCHLDKGHFLTEICGPSDLVVSLQWYTTGFTVVKAIGSISLKPVHLFVV